MMESVSDTPENRQSGFTLVVVLGLLALLMSVLVAFAVSARLQFRAVINHADEMVTRVNEKAAMQVIASVAGPVMRARTADAGSGAPSCVSSISDTLQFRLRLSQHSGRIDLNAAGAELISRGLQAAGLSEQAAADAADVIVAYRSADSDVRDDEKLGVTGGIKAGPFEHIAELSDFLLLDHIPMEKLGEIFTVHSRSGTVDALHAAPSLAGLLDPSDPFVVSGATRMTALTAEFETSREGGFRRSGSVLLTLTSGAAGEAAYAIAEPMRSSHLSGAQKINAVEECSVLLPADAYALVVKVLS